ncbi:class I ribonucleotide reductase maintenance protein YfaE [Idiomarina xiamenensis]|uniref:(Fe-S)-binding protein n=1 Tax=Idiomarina xiamenensis 10-D-4 TaxID=740709 RepID=K2KWQ5_9GAMM|nr:class I ribonucleotide reductase maintenance protein YfaE [Idiomarina xiamenensis]EKE86924.1 (Fe-S)-binding protein [Idiomarina xiamenensis 10-D-4]
MAKAFKVKLNGQHELTVDASQGSLLEALEQHQIDVHYHCRNGFCGACRTKLICGKVKYTSEPLAFIRKGDILPCCCIADSDIEIEH